jgi:tRNA/rRNA methyltransferase
MNIGMAARAMANFGLGDLRLVAPRDGWPNPDAGPGSSRRRPCSGSNADDGHACRSAGGLPADLCNHGSPARHAKPVVTPREAAAMIREGQRGG